MLAKGEDLGLFVQPIPKLVGGTGYRTNVLVRRAILNGDRAAVDIAIRRDRMNLRDVRIDRSERVCNGGRSLSPRRRWKRRCRAFLDT